jgi:hypothetical protein
MSQLMETSITGIGNQLVIHHTSTTLHIFFRKRKLTLLATTSFKVANHHQGCTNPQFPMRQLINVRILMKPLMARSRSLRWTASMIQV